MHAYVKTSDGVEARHYVENKSKPGELRPTTLRDVRKWLKNGEIVVPSVTTILNVLDKGALTQWLVSKHLEQAYGLAKEWQWATIAGDWFDEDGFIPEVKRRTKEELDKAPEAGTAVHKSLEDYMLGGEPAPEHYDICRNVEAKLKEKCGDVQWLCEESFVDPRGFGGCADLVADDAHEVEHPHYGPHDGFLNGRCSECAHLTRRNCWVVDYKTKETADKFKPGKMAYESHSIQLAAYRRGLGMPSARVANLFICIETGEVDFHEHSEEDLEKGGAIFENALSIYKVRNGL